ncbi:N2,N2-dimethylguanosine tRNA methyltransferas-like protein [Plenodomus tracheiphilus IPT5]|uniref:tRNA (guanine(26)-N(2))-dimethyltransferase n=1 Tax=Plenodomus tracheiphilus IPT5 TaxID=1408161 RepID=A0A6A7BAM0_9PLEO|nr:N2,N2-dimethylguanosine tRNA methyltransferas-like protein [Plenodomus tracheiphilus IPT5]
MTSTDAPMSDAASKTIDNTPQAGQNVSHDGKSYTTIKEGLAHILVPHDIPTQTDPKKLSKEDTQRQQVFYNPIQQFNRDLSVLAIKTFGQDLIQQRLQKHEAWKAKAERRKARIEKERITGERASTPSTPQPEEGTSNKRKLELDAADAGAARSKKQKVAENGEAEQEVHMEANGEQTNGANGERVPWTPPFKILDALSATGLRAIRYAREIPFATGVTSNDMSQKAVESIKLNVKHNKLEDKVTVNTGNAIAYMYSFCDKKGYDAIDLDPYGTAAPFIDSAIQAINDEGMLLVTCTDSAIFASHGYLEKTYSQYGGLPLKGEPCHEGGLRLILHAIASSAARYGMAIEPLLSLSIDYYARVFVRVRKAPIDVKLLAGKTMIVYHCESGCGAWTTQYLARNKPMENKNGAAIYKHGFAQAPTADQHCQHCGFKTHLSGPMYGGPLHNVGFIERVLAQLNEADRETYPTMDRIQGMLHTAMEEITYGSKTQKSNGVEKTEVVDPLIPKMDPAAIEHHPFFIVPGSIAKIIHVSAPPVAALRGALRHAGFRVTMSHCKPGSIKTDASWTDIWHIMLEWARQRAPLKKALNVNTAGHAILSKASATGHTKIPNAEAPVEVPANETTSESQNDEGSTEASVPTVAKDLPTYRDVRFEVNFDEKLGRDHDRGKYVRYQLAPRENWGPMSRAK